MRTITSDVVEVLRDGGLTVGDGNNTTRPDGSGTVLAAPYVIVYPLSDVYDGAIGGGAVWAEVDATVQASCVATTREQAEWLADQVHTLILAADEDWRARPLPRPAIVRDDDTGGPPLFYAYPRFALHAWT